MDVVKGGVNEAAVAIQNLLNPTETQKPESTPTETPETESVVEETSTENNEPETVEAPAPETEQQTYTVKVDGEEISVTLDELRKGYSRTEYFHRKLSEIDLRKKEAEAEINAIKEERSHLAQLLPQLQAELEKGEKEPDWESLFKDDPIEFVRQEALWRQKKEKHQRILQEQARLVQLNQQEQQKLMQAQVQREAELLHKAIPEWKDPVIMQKEKADILEYALGLGYSQDEMNQVIDHRAVVLLRKARAYDEAKSKMSNLKPTAPPVKGAKPGNIPPPKNTEFEKAKQSFRTAPTVRNAAQAIERLISPR